MKAEMAKMHAETAEWWIYNQGTDLEFAECSGCGYEVEPVNVACVQGEKNNLYPAECPRCGAKIVDEVKAEDVDYLKGQDE